MNVVDLALRKVDDNFEHDKTYNNVNDNFGKLNTLVAKMGYANMQDDIFVVENVEET